MLPSLLVSLARFAPPAYVAVAVLAIVALRLDSIGLWAAAAALYLYGLGCEMTEPDPDLSHEYCPCEICDPPADDTCGGA